MTNPETPKAEADDDSQTFIHGTGWQDPPEDRPSHPASDSVGRQQAYGPTGLKSEEQ